MAEVKATRGRKAGTETKGVTVNWAAQVTEDIDMPSRLQKSIVDDTPFPAWYEESWESGKAKAIYNLTQDQVDEAKRLSTMACYRVGKIWGGEFKTGIRHHIAPDPDHKGKLVYSFFAVDRTKAEEADAEAGEEATE